MTQYIDGKALAAKVKARVREEAAKLSRKPGLAVILVGENPASKVYVAGKEKDCTEFASDCELTNTESLRFHLKVGFLEANRIICFTKKI